MIDEKFEWDDDKALENLKKHEVSFESARRVFDDVFGVGYLDDREDYGEERWIRLGMVSGTILFVVYTERSDRKRIISAREAVKMEIDHYYMQNASE
jgi:uncharacterized DUF497 family protein